MRGSFFPEKKIPTRTFRWVLRTLKQISVSSLTSWLLLRRLVFRPGAPSRLFLSEDTHFTRRSFIFFEASFKRVWSAMCSLAVLLVRRPNVAARTLIPQGFDFSHEAAFKPIRASWCRPGNIRCPRSGEQIDSRWGWDLMRLSKYGR